jgi:single-stranded DNA-binding protein
MRGVNKVVISGNIGDRITYGQTGSGTQACSFSIASDRKDGREIITAWARVNVYGDELVRDCRERLTKGGYAIVEGELMNRDGKVGELTEIRAREIVFVNNHRK